MKQYLASAAFGVALLGFGSANATLIDFTTGDWKSNNPQTIGGVLVTVQAYDKDGNPSYFSETGFDGDSSKCGELACISDGLGVGDDEITFDGSVGNDSSKETHKQHVERIKVTFDQAVSLESLLFLDLFGVVGNDPEAEVAQFQVNGDGKGGTFTGTALDTTGFLEGILTDSGDFLNVTMIEFFADEYKTSSPANSDFALAGIRLASVPEPGTLALLGAGLLGLGLARRRRS